MVMMSPFCKSPLKIALVFFALSCPPLSAKAGTLAVEPLTFKGIYEFRFAGLPFGKLGVEITQTDTEYSIAADVASTGIINLFTRHTSHSVVKEKRTAKSNEAVNYETYYRTKNKPRHVKLTYSDGKITEEIVEPPENPAKRLPVPAEVKNAATNPLSLILQMREKLAETQDNKEPAFSLNVYDGRRATKVDFTIKDQQTINVNGQKQPVTEVELHRQPLAGFTESELADYDPKEPTLRLYFTNDTRLIPIKAEVTVMMAPLTATLVKECGAEESCLLGNKD